MCYKGQEGEIGLGDQCHTLAALLPGKIPDTNCTGGCVSLGLKILPPPGFDLQTIQPVVSCYFDWAIPIYKKVVERNK
jgi:hypothetical protein